MLALGFPKDLYLKYRSRNASAFSLNVTASAFLQTSQVNEAFCPSRIDKISQFVENYLNLTPHSF
jgi:hypothetical protein